MRDAVGALLRHHGKLQEALRVLLEESQQLKADAEKLLSGAGVEGEVRSNFEVGMVRTPKLSEARSLLYRG